MAATSLAPSAAHLTTHGDALSVRQITENVARIQSVMEAVMKENVHYGKIPGTPKPSLWKPGAELLCMTFRIAPDPDRIEDISGIDRVGVQFFRYRVRMIFTAIGSGAFLGASMGECSSLEEKYKWRRASGTKEFEATPVDRRRAKFKRGQNNSEYEEKQVRTEADDLSNTILQMAMKRALVAGTKQVTACSDIFAQDLEDLPAEIVSSIENEDKPAAPQASTRLSQQGANGTGETKTTPAATETKAPATETKAPATPSAASERGKVAEIIDAPGGAWIVKLNTGFQAGSRNADLKLSAEQVKVSGTVVELKTTPAKDARFAPTLVDIVPVSQTTQQG